ncbi:MAG: restriction endonuclease subunit S [Phenylobacterium sp.]|uniref:restriction endonuclease subunit S n=1 Tax=Phenylobacterium sp. TaxID=1871053 RepID=UPI00271DB88B|nr:restriction endonuclease subunit S [Phenylobacterium sp.]MDO8410652.1 restriction endonuclease subunit S [Phenylobacterium sp.]
MSAHLIEELRPLNMADDEVYALVTVRRSRGGVVLRERLRGSQIAVKSQFRLKAGDFLISKRQIVHGACGIVPPELDGAIVSNEYAVLRARPSLHLEFLNCLAHSIYFQQTCFHSSIGVHVEKMIFKLQEWLKWDFDLPPAREQRRIAEILATWDRAIETVGGLIANAREQKAAMMQALLTGERRLPGFDQPWRQVTLSELGTFRKGKGISRAEVRPSGLPCVRYGEIYTLHHDLIQEFGSYIDRASASLSEPIGRGDILFACSGETAEEIGKCVAFDGPERAYAGGDIVVFTPQGENSVFLAYLLNSPKLAIQKAQMGQGNAVVHISASNLARLKFAIPPRDEQDAIAEHLRTADVLVRSQLAKLLALKQEKAALMQQLLSGKRRVSPAESEAA